jgi:LysM repeat protein
MFTKYNNDEYEAATEYASINTYDEENKKNYKVGIFNLFLLTTICVMGYVGFDSFTDKSSFVEKMNILTATEKTVELKSDSEYLDMLTSMDVDNLDAVINVNQQVKLTDALNDIVNKEMDGVKKVETITVQKGDTLASISEKYYGDASAFDKIILANNTLTSESSMIYVGQTIYLP